MAAFDEGSSSFNKIVYFDSYMSDRPSPAGMVRKREDHNAIPLSQVNAGNLTSLDTFIILRLTTSFSEQLHDVVKPFKADIPFLV
jgi:hypothetical protein